MNIELYQKYFRKNNKGLVLLILIIGVGTVVNGLNPYIYGKIIDSISGKNIIILKKWLLCLGIVLIVTLILETVESLIGNWLTNIIENQIKNDLFAHITIMECKNLDIYEEGELFNKIEFDAENIVSYYLDFVTSILMIVFNLGISVYFILNISKKLAAITFITIPVLYLYCSDDYESLSSLTMQIIDELSSYAGNNEVQEINNIVIEDVEEKVMEIIKQIGEKDCAIDCLKNESLFGEKIKMRARDMLVVFFELEKQFDICFTEDDIKDYTFVSIEKISACIKKHLNK